MKKMIFLFCLSMVFVLSAGAQLNPIKNLSWSHWYVSPMNCYELSWDKPDTSLTDTLVGYNIYRDDSLYSFTTELYHDCVPCYGIPDSIMPFCSFDNYYYWNFYIHITAVYNSAHNESIYNDSVNFGGLIVGTKTEQENKIPAIVSVIQDRGSLMIEMNESMDEGEIGIYNLPGQMISSLKCDGYKSIKIYLPDIRPGIYILNLRTEHIIDAKKIIII